VRGVRGAVKAKDMVMRGGREATVEILDAADDVEVS
jgi:hypothetical protein